MPSFDIVKQSSIDETFRVSAVISRFDIKASSIKERFEGTLDIDTDWQIGLIVGKSGTGKTTIAKQLFGDTYFSGFEYSEKSILDDMPEHCTVEEITKMFNSVGFSSPPSWLKPYQVLSNGEKMRVDLARAILSNQDLIVFDEFTSVVDRNIAKVGSFAVQKAIRKLNKKFIAVTCHNDVEDWLMPDWVFNTDNMEFVKSEAEKKSPKCASKYTKLTKKTDFGKFLESIII